MTLYSLCLYDNYEISPCTRTEVPDKPGQFYFEVCEPHEADVWTLYGHCPEGGVEAIGDFATREAAETAFQRIVGIPFGGHEEVAARVKQMHAAGSLLEALELMVRWTEKHGLNTAELITGQRAEVPVVGIARAAIAQATGTSAERAA